MQRFRIKKDELINFSVFHKGEKVIQKTISGFSNITDLMNCIKQKIGYPLQGCGRRIEIEIVNIDTAQTKYLNTFS